MGLIAEALFSDPKELFVALLDDHGSELRDQPGYSRVQLNEWKRIVSWTATERDWDQKISGYQLLKNNERTRTSLIGSGPLFEHLDGMRVMKGDTVNVHFDFNVEGVPLGVFQAMFEKLRTAYAEGRILDDQAIDWRRVVEL
jgi:hypothetical protein